MSLIHEPGWEVFQEGDLITFKASVPVPFMSEDHLQWINVAAGWLNIDPAFVDQFFTVPFFHVLIAIFCVSGLHHNHRVRHCY